MKQLLCNAVSYSNKVYYFSHNLPNYDELQ